jgi:hypothetical protein
VLSGRVLCDRLITRPEKSYRLCCVWVWSWILDNEEVLVHWGLLCHGKTLTLNCHDILSTVGFVTTNDPTTNECYKEQIYQ